MSRFYSAKADDNQAEIVAEFRMLGANVFHVHRLKKFCDIIIVYLGITIAVEIKDGSKPPSQRKLTKGELEFKEEWTEKGGWWELIENLTDVRTLMDNLADYTG